MQKLSNIYRLCKSFQTSIPLSIAHPNGTMRKCKKADALKILLPSNTKCSKQPPLVNALSAFNYNPIAGIVRMKHTKP